MTTAATAIKVTSKRPDIKASSEIFQILTQSFYDRSFLIMNQKEILDQLSFRMAQSADLPALVELVNSAYRGDSSRKGWTTEADILDGQRTDVEMLSEFISKEKHWMIVGNYQNQIVSTVQLEKVGSDTCYFGMFTVKPEMQTFGIGKTFLKWIENFAQMELGCRQMEMTVITVRKDLIPWYEKQGYQYTGEDRDFPYGFERFGIPLRKDLRLGLWRKRL